MLVLAVQSAHAAILACLCAAHSDAAPGALYLMAIMESVRRQGRMALWKAQAFLLTTTNDLQEAILTSIHHGSKPWEVDWVRWNIFRLLHRLCLGSAAPLQSLSTFTAPVLT